MRWIIALFSLLLATACAQPPQVPDWIDGESQDYSVTRYLLGRGQADLAALARDRARADLAKNFTVKVREQSIDQLLWQQGGVGLQGLQAQASRDIQIQTEQLVEGVQIVESWRGEEGGDYHVLAVLDRLQAGTRLRSRIHQLDNETEENISRARTEETLPERIAAGRNALSAQIDRYYQQKMLTIVDASGVGVRPRYQLAELKNDFEQLLDRWRIAPQVAGDELGDLQGLLAGALANSGVLHRAKPEEADYLLVGDLSSQELQGADGWHWLRGTLQVSLLEPKSGSVLGRHQWTYKTSSRQVEMVEIRARKQLADILDRELLQVLIGFGHDERLKTE
ncbi:MAG: LPP20 family lipoprotein [Desulfuromusa sp.]|nr:LPP20 family lipoprotein [Desulfuromusa sp.]